KKIPPVSRARSAITSSSSSRCSFRISRSYSEAGTPLTESDGCLEPSRRSVGLSAGGGVAAGPLVYNQMSGVRPHRVLSRDARALGRRGAQSLHMNGLYRLEQFLRVVSEIHCC